MELDGCDSVIIAASTFYPKPCALMVVADPWDTNDDPVVQPEMIILLAFAVGPTFTQLRTFCKELTRIASDPVVSPCRKIQQCQQEPLSHSLLVQTSGGGVNLNPCQGRAVWSRCVYLSPNQIKCNGPDIERFISGSILTAASAQTDPKAYGQGGSNEHKDKDVAPFLPPSIVHLGGRGHDGRALSKFAPPAVVRVVFGWDLVGGDGVKGELVLLCRGRGLQR
mmetsp:Transcript_11555/g.24110  ORF Transcript_11555/g.24110 Transcript_11555/m.24110 type:complete len:223 (-) Transcript_11555:247-915(-)